MALNLTLRIKGVLAVTVLIGYLALIAVYLGDQRSDLVSIVRDMEANQARATMLEPVVGTLARSLIESQTILNSQDGQRIRPVSFDDLDGHIEALNRDLGEVSAAFPSIAPRVAQFRQAVGAVKAVPAAHHLAQVRDSGQLLLANLQSVLHDVRVQNVELAQRYRDKQQFISVFAVSANVVGALASVAVILMFFTRLAKDITRLKNRAAAIVAGYRGPPLRNTRRDEIGGLIEAVNRMQADLRGSEQQMELVRQQRFHEEKMAAVGSLASAIGHEVSNPIAAISGVAQFIVDETCNDARDEARRIGEFASHILKQTDRIAHIMREMATLTAPRSPDAELLDLNALVLSTCSFVRFDKRFRGIEFEQTLDHELPAVTAVADHLTQILMNLLINAADATEQIGEGRSIRVTTRVAGQWVELAVADNGRGMTPDVLAKAFDESFTTKPAGRGRGIGLFVCKGLIEKAGGRIKLVSAAGEGTTATVRFPLAPAPATVS